MENVKEIAYVTGSICEDLEEIHRLNDAAGRLGYILVCEFCRKVSEPIIVIVTLPSEDAVFGLCGPCYRNLSRHLLGRAT